MSIKGFIINSQTVKYDYDSLDNLPENGTGVSEELKQALLQLAQKVAYIDDDGQDYYDNLYDALYPVGTYSVSNTLVGCVNSNTATVVEIGGSYAGTLTATDGYSMTGATVVITMGGVNITGTSYLNGTISIPNVTGNIIITATATSLVLSSISAVFTQGSAVIYDTDSLDSLKQYLTVTATYSDSSTQVVTGYTLSGTLEAGTSTITVSYGGKTDTFSVTVTDYRSVMSYKYSDGDLTKFNGTIYNDTTYGHGFCLSTVGTNPTKRRAFVIERGKSTLYYISEAPTSAADFTITNPPLYPIPVPPTATQVVVAITPNNQYFGISGLNLNNGEYALDLDDGWKQGTRTLTFAAGTYTHIGINCKYDSGGTTYLTEPSELTVTFS